MRKLIFVLLITAAGCATQHAPVPVPTGNVQEPQTAHVAPLPEPSAEKPAAIATQPASPMPESAPTVSQPIAAEKKEPKHQPAEAHKPEEQAQPPIVALKQPQIPIIEQRKKLSPEMREKPIPSHRQQSLAAQAAQAAANDEKIINVFVGMYRNTVETIMGSDHNPYRKTKITGTDGEVYDVLFYLTREPRPGKPVTSRMLSPIIIRKGRVVAMGNYQLKKLIRDGTLERRRPALSVN
jgi:outer membrane biosynthesis protein TonB